jgi:threonine synthase
MLQDGFYQVTLNGPFGKGLGVVVLENNVLRGGDDLFIYEGSFGQTGSGADVVAIEADLSALIYSPNSSQKGQKFQVKCSGAGQGNSFQVRGQFVTGETVTVQGRFISRLQF